MKIYIRQVDTGFYLSTNENSNGKYLHRNGNIEHQAVNGKYDMITLYTKDDSSWHKTIQEAVDTCDRLGYEHNHPELSKKKVVNIVYTRCVNAYHLEFKSDDTTKWKVLYRNGEINNLGYVGNYADILTSPTSTWHKTLDEAINTCKKHGYKYLIEGKAQPKRLRTKPKVYYKVVKKDTLLSARHGILSSYDCHKIQYKIDEWVYAPLHEGIRTKLFVFDNLESAQKFANNRGVQDEAIYECHIKNPVKMFPVDIGVVHEWWTFINRLRKLRKGVNWEAIPANTVMILKKELPSIGASAVKLIKKVA